MDKKKVTGRKPLDETKKRNPVKVFFNQDELSNLMKRKGEDDTALSIYLRELILNDSKKPSHINPVDFFKEIKKLSIEVNKIGVNINQLARHVNELTLQNVIPVNVADSINDKLGLYLLKQDEIMASLKGIIKK